MALPDLILPQATDNVIQSADIALVGAWRYLFLILKVFGKVMLFTFGGMGAL